MQRRNFLCLAAALPLTTLLQGCGSGWNLGFGPVRGGGSGNSGGSDVTPNLTMTRTPVSVKLPDGFAIPLDQLRLSNIFEDAALSAARTAEIIFTSPTRALTFLNDASGNPVLVGIVGPGQTEISAESTAQALLYFALQYNLLPQELQGNALDRLKASPQTATLTAEVAAALVRNPRALSEGDAALSAAAKSAAQSLGQYASRSVNINPKTVKSGMELLQSDGFNTISIANRWRLRKIAFINKISYIDQNGTEVPSTYPSFQKFELSPPKEVTGYFAAISDGFVSFFYNDAVNWVETRSDPVTLPVEPSTARKTSYEVLVCGPGFTLGEVSRLTQPQANEYNDLVKKSFFLDFLLPFVINIGAGIGYFPGDASKVTFGDVKFLEGIYTSLKEEIGKFLVSQSGIAEKVAKGDIFGAFTDFMYAFLSTDLFRNSLIPLFRKITEYILNNKVYKGTFSEQWKNAVSDSTKYEQQFAKATTALAKVLKIIAVIDIVLQAKDTLEQRVAWGQSVAVERWTVDANTAKISITPEDAIVAKGNAIALTAKIVEGSLEGGTAPQYEWSCQSGTFDDGKHPPAPKLLTSDASVKYTPTGPAGTMDTISVDVTAKKASDVQPVGSASTKVLTVEIKITPSEQKLKATTGEKATFTAELVGMRALKTGEEIKFKWLSTRRVGQLLDSPDGGTSVPVESTLATYLASGSEGGDLVTVEAFLGNRTLGKNSAKVTIGAETVVVAGRFKALSLNPKDQNIEHPFYWVTAYVIAPRVQGAKSYSVLCTGFNDPAYYGTTLSKGLRPDQVDHVADFDGVTGGLEIGQTSTEIYFAIAGGTPGPENVDSTIAYYEDRFKGMKVEVTAHL